jgi:linoleoyl-CoA desaturase
MAAHRLFSPAAPREGAELASGPLKFDRNDDFFRALRLRVDRYFTTTGRTPRDCPRMYVKTAIVLAALAVAYVLLVFWAATWWQALPPAALLGLAGAAVGFNIQHDANHRAYSGRAWINKTLALTLDLIGGSSYVWARKHNSIHHSYANITGQDDDINLGSLGRLSPHQPRLAFHRWQHFYLWFLYGFLPLKWHLFDDFRDVLVGRIGDHRLPRPKSRELAVFLGGKAVFFSLAFALPLLLHPLWLVLAFYAGVSFVEGVVLSVVFQMAHCVEEAEFPLPRRDTGRMATSWAAHQVESTVDFAPRNRLLSWFIGGLNFQIEHHLFPQICHVHYPALAPLVRETCAEFGLRYSVNQTFRAGAASHFRWLRRMGRPEAAREHASPAAAY